MMRRIDLALVATLTAVLAVSCQSEDEGAAPNLGGGGSQGSGAVSGSATSGAGTTSSQGGSGNTSSQGGAATLGCSAPCSLPVAGSCSSPQVRIVEIDVGVTVLNNESETELLPLVLAAIPAGGSRLAWMGDDDAVHVAELDCDDQLVTPPFALPAHDFQDIAADDAGGVVVLTRDAQGGGTLNCGDPTNLCDGGPETPIPCFDMFMVRYDCTGDEQWSTLLTSASATLPPYSTGPEGPTVHMVWWYQHQGRIAYDGSNYAAYFCDAVSTSENGCINIHQADRMQVVGPSGALLGEHDDAFDLGCSHSGFTRIVWDESTGHFVMVCKTDNDNRLALPAPYRTIYPVDLASSNVGDLVVASGGGYWLTASNLGSVHLLHFSDGEADQDIVLAEGDFPHLAAFGSERLLVAWASGEALVAQVRDAGDGSSIATDIPIAVPGNRFQSFESFPDGSVAYVAPGTSPTTLRIARILPCAD